MAEPPTVRMFNEYTSSWPFWGEDGERAVSWTRRTSPSR